MTRRYKYTCIVDTPYALALYLLKMDCEAIPRTFFCVGRNLAQEIFDRLPSARRFDMDQRRSRFVRLAFRIKCFYHHFLFVRGRSVYAQDHLNCSSQLICRTNYTLIEDGPRSYSMNKDLPGRRLVEIENPFLNMAVYLMNGSVYLKSFGRNAQCVNRWVTTDEDADLYQRDGAKIERLDVGLMWRQASREKKEAISCIFNGDGFDWEVGLRSNCAETILLTQPMIEDCGLSEDEFATIYRACVDRYLPMGVVIKPHPRDKFNYKKHFPNCKVMSTRVPMQLLCAFGMNFKRAVTICSTAVSDFPEETEIVWIGNEINSKILSVYGHVDPPWKFRHVVRVTGV